MAARMKLDGLGGRVGHGGYFSRPPAGKRLEVTDVLRYAIR